MIIACPLCKRDTLWHHNNPSRPFCSDRCKLIDLGQWANEGYRLHEEASVKAADEPQATGGRSKK